MVIPERLIVPTDQFREGFPELSFRENYCVETSGEMVLLTDPTYLADVYNSKDEIASFLRSHGVIVMDFGGDVSGPVWWQHPYLLLPISIQLTEDDLKPTADIEVLADEVGTDSGSFIFLLITDDLPPALQMAVEKVVTESNGALLELPAGKWSVYYEQWEPPEHRLAGLYRNIVAKLD